MTVKTLEKMEITQLIRRNN